MEQNDKLPDFVKALYKKEQEQKLNQIMEWAKEKPAMIEYELEEMISKIAFAVFAIIGTLIATHAVSIAGIESYWVFCFVPLFGFLYWTEYKNVPMVFRQISHKRNKKESEVSKARLGIAVVISVLNITGVLFGTIQITKNETNTVEKVSRNSFSKDSLQIVSDYNNEKIRIEKAIEATQTDNRIKYGEYAGTIDFTGRKLIAKLQNDLSVIRDKKDADLAKFEGKIETEKTVKKSAIQNYFWVKLLFSIAIEFILIGCCLFIGHYKMKVYWQTEGTIEQEKNKKSLNKNVPMDLTTDSKDFVEPNSDETDKKKVTGHALWHLQ